MASFDAQEFWDDIARRRQAEQIEIEQRSRRELERFWDEHPDRHVAVKGPRFNQQTGEVVGYEAVYERHETDGTSRFVEPVFKPGYLDYLRGAIADRAEWQESYRMEGDHVLPRDGQSPE